VIDNAIKQLIEQTAGPGVEASPTSSTVQLKAAKLPRITFTALGGPRGYNDDGLDGLVTARYQLDVFALDVATCRELIARLTARSTATPPGLDDFMGTVKGTAIVRISFPELPRAGDTVDLNGTGSNVAVSRLMQDAMITYRT
jgi:hypothetical protein